MRERDGCIYLMIAFFWLVAALETAAPEALLANPNHKQTKIVEDTGDESGQTAKARGALSKKRGEVSISH